MIFALILCVFSGAFSQGMPIREGNGIEFEEQLSKKLSSSRSNGLSVDSIRSFVVDLRKQKGKGFSRETLVQQVPRMSWMITDSGSRLVGKDIRRYAGTRGLIEAPGRTLRDQQYQHSYTEDYVYVENEIPWVGFPLSCGGRLALGERFKKENVFEVIVTTPCSKVEFLFLIDQASGLPRSLEFWNPGLTAEDGIRRCFKRIHYLAWSDGRWRMPSKVRIDLLWKHPFVDWVSTDYEVSTWINPELDSKFFDLPMSKGMNEESWKEFLMSPIMRD